MEVYNEENGNYYTYCEICDKYSISLYYKNHLKSASHTNNLNKLQKVQNKSFFSRL